MLYESKNKFVKQLVFPSYEVMKTSCPWLKTPILLPAAWLVRYKRALTASRGNIGYHIERAKTFDRVEDQGKYALLHGKNGADPRLLLPLQQYFPEGHALLRPA